MIKKHADQFENIVDQINSQVQRLFSESAKAMEGNKAAGVRVRASLKEIRALCARAKEESLAMHRRE